MQGALESTASRVPGGSAHHPSTRVEPPWPDQRGCVAPSGGGGGAYGVAESRFFAMCTTRFRLTPPHWHTLSSIVKLQKKLLWEAWSALPRTRGVWPRGRFSVTGQEGQPRGAGGRDWGGALACCCVFCPPGALLRFLPSRLCADADVWPQPQVQPLGPGACGRGFPL